jgi:hypothetical protein
MLFRPLRATDWPYNEALNGSNGTQAGSLCYINAVASSLQVHDDSSQDGLGRMLGGPEGQCSIGFQPVFFGVPSDVLQVSAVPPSCL